VAKIVFLIIILISCSAYAKDRIELYDYKEHKIYELDVSRDGKSADLYDIKERTVRPVEIEEDDYRRLRRRERRHREDERIFEDD
jgi:hypothetical protein